MNKFTAWRKSLNSLKHEIFRMYVAAASGVAFGIVALVCGLVFNSPTVVVVGGIFASVYLIIALAMIPRAKKDWKFADEYEDKYGWF